ncbi:Gfo/Idh/MocA family oxidoreductase [Propioniciclava coleopterorum]|uniref:Gfo/Idh/MocA family oxidoreductase n=1 Tax=Propioniciclava coleopterorum TaxID=2714937 RepID=A0A6G7Y4Z4_9ACTN|nr:Gfo/Idh/MocA family oxidoreductase [Propioniciclava coleopterorum]QIK71736.1 Gfo/Idh/MocA family oxidoreductase [Propioniciclava coleopterorum]
MDTVRWGIIGVGDVTEAKSGPGFQRAAGSELVAVMRRSPGMAQDYAARHGVPRWYSDADALIHDPEVDAVYVATPPDSHADYAIRVARAGKPVYVEKPMARTAAECRAMIDASASAHAPLFVAYYRRAMPRFVQAAEVAHADLGELRTVTVRLRRPAAQDAALPWRLDPAVAGGGLFVDLASHTLDWLDHALGPLGDVHGVATHPLAGPGSAETSVAASFRIGDITGTGSWDFASDGVEDLIEIGGTAGTLRLSSFGTEPLQLTRGATTTTIEAPYPDVVQQPLIQQIVDHLTGRGSTPVSTGATALRTATVVDTVLAGYRAEHGIRFV